MDLTNRAPAPQVATAERPSGTTGDEGSSPAAEVAVSIEQFRYDPNPLSATADATIVVTNKDGAKHTFTSGKRDNPDGRFDLKLDGGASATTSPLAAGSYPYYCSIHPGMKGTLEVTP